MAKRWEYEKRNRITNANAIKAKIDKTQAESKCRLCGKVDETVRHIVCKCPMLAQSEYKSRHDWVGRKIHWEICRKSGFDVNEKWYKHEPEKVVENDSWKMLWDFTIQTDHVIEARRHDMVIIDKTKNECEMTLHAPLIGELKKGRKIR